MSGSPEDMLCWEMQSLSRSREAFLIGPCERRLCLKVAEWLGERLATPYMFKYIPSERDRSLTSDFQNKHLISVMPSTVL